MENFEKRPLAKKSFTDERSLAQKTAYFVISFMGNVQKRQVYGDRSHCCQDR
jgi:hypothetical protein